MSDSSVDAAREICDVLDALLLIAMYDRAPLRAVSLLEQARSELQNYLDKIDRDAHPPTESARGLKAKFK